MKKSILKIVFLFVVVFLLVVILFEVSYSKYSKKDEIIAVSGIAKPCLSLITEESLNIETLNSDTFIYEFKVQNSEDGQVSETAFYYDIEFELSQENAPINIKLYRVDENSEEEILLEENKTKNPEYMGTKLSEICYKALISYDLNSNKILEPNLKINAKIEGIQEEEKYE